VEVGDRTIRRKMKTLRRKRVENREDADEIMMDERREDENEVSTVESAIGLGALLRKSSIFLCQHPFSGWISASEGTGCAPKDRILSSRQLRRFLLELDP
jgi:hypothetical protein